MPAAPGSNPSGYFILVSPDAVDPARYMALGDWAHALTLYIEVERPGLRVDLYDPGVFDPARPTGQLDENVDTTPPLEPAQIRYVLKSPTGAVLANVTYGPDTVATDQRLVNLFTDNAAVPGIYQLDVNLLDGVAVEQDVTAFGVSVPGHQMFTYNLTGGQVNQGGARIAEPLSVFPWLVAGSAGADAFGQLCGVSFVSYDLDAELDTNGDPVAPPSTDVTTRRGYRFPAGEIPPSGDARWTQTKNGGLPSDLLDSNDLGTWTWEFTDLTVPEDAFNFVNPPFDLNCFSIQILDYGAPARNDLNWPSLPPFGDSNPRRLYLPQDDGSAPQREWLGHSARVVSGFPVVAQGQTSTLEVTLELGNPHAYDLTSVVGESHVTPDPQVGDPVLVGSSGGLTATITGRRIDFTGTVAAGTTATVVYRVDITPTALGREFLTGDDADFISPSAPTIARYLTPYVPSLNFRQEVLGPACQIEYESVVPGCTSVARLTPERLQACPGTDIRLDALASQVVNCAGGVPIYQWSVNGSVIQAFPAPDTITVTPFLNDTWSVEVACSTDPACTSSDAVTFDLYPALDVAVTADVTTICPGDPVNLGATIANGTPPYANGRWTTQPPGAPGDGSTSATLTVNPLSGVTYTYSADDALGCSGSDSVVITADVPAPVITPTSLDLCPGDSAPLSADAGWASYAWTTVPVDPAVEGATTPDVTVSQTGTTYTVTVTNAAGCRGSASVTVGASADPVPGPVGPTLRLTRPSPDVALTWADIADPASGYEAVFLECPTRDYRVSCGGRVPDAATLAASPATGSAVAPGTQATTHAGALGLGDLIFYYVRALSPCSAAPGPVR